MAKKFTTIKLQGHDQEVDFNELNIGDLILIQVQMHRDNIPNSEAQFYIPLYAAALALRKKDGGTFSVPEIMKFPMEDLITISNTLEVLGGFININIK